MNTMHQVEISALNQQEIDQHIRKAQALRSQMAHKLVKASVVAIANILMMPVKFVRQALSNDTGAAKA